MKALFVLAGLFLVLTVTATAAPAHAPVPYAAVRSCLTEHRFTVTHEAHGQTFGWELDASIPWRLNGGSGQDNAIVVVASTIRAAKAYQARLARLLRLAYTGEGYDKVSNYLHRVSRVVYGWTFRPESLANQRTLAICAGSP